MIAEQDFILRIRRMHRLNMPGVAVNIARHMPDYDEGVSDPEATDIREIAGRSAGEIHMMSNGDIFVLFPAAGLAPATAFRDQAGARLHPDKTPDEQKAGITIYRLPEDYAALRESANAYIEQVRSAEVMGPLRQAEQALQQEDVRGPLTAWSLSQVERLLNSLDIKRYVRTQPVYAERARGVWERSFIDFYVSIGDLQRERFPRLVLETPERLFLDMCCTLDRRLFQELSYQADNWKDKNISLNMAAETVLSPMFAQFCHVLPDKARPRVAFDIHRSDLFLNFTTTCNAMAVLKKEGFQVGVDGILPATLPYINFNLFPADYFKIDVARDRFADLREPAALRALAALDRGRIIFNRCDTEEALRFGQDYGISRYQGWLIDDVANVIPH